MTSGARKTAQNVHLHPKIEHADEPRGFDAHGSGGALVAQTGGTGWAAQDGVATTSLVAARRLKVMIGGRHRKRRPPTGRWDSSSQDGWRPWWPLVALVSMAAMLAVAWSWHTQLGDADGFVLPTPTTQAMSSPRRDPVIAAAGDIAPADCQGCGDLATATLVNEINPTVVLPLGDTQYPAGALKDYQNGYDYTWGSFKDKSRPVPGDNEYDTRGAAGYFSYFGRLAKPRGRSYYSFNLGNWHLIALDSNIRGGRGSAQERWLRADLARTSKRCILAYWHLPLFASHQGKRINKSVEAFWTDLYRARADVVLNGHWHLYERMTPQDPSGAHDARHGIRQFIVGTGGAPLLGATRTRLATTQKLVGRTYGVLQMNLHARSYSWQFIDVEGVVRDSGRQACH